uniref:MIF4G domain-containing protein n=1 Tax=Macrostomum lignano TaxID=282301 RepID=A0A1I8FMS4_9PLAT
NIADIIKQLESRDWQQRRDGLASLTSYLSRDSCRLNSAEVRKICDIFTRLFGETNGRLLAKFVTKFHAELHDWLYTLQMRLVGRLATETLLTSQQSEYKRLWNVSNGISTELQFQQLLRSLSWINGCRLCLRVAEVPVVANQQEASATAAGLQAATASSSLGTARTASGTGRPAAQDIQSLTGTSSAGRATWAEPRSVASAAAAAATSSRNGQTNQRLANRNYQQQQPAYQLPSYQADPFSADDYQQLMMQPQPQQQSLQSGDLLLADIVRELSGARNQ